MPLAGGKMGNQQREQGGSSADGGRAGRIAQLDYDYASQPKLRRTRCNLCGGDRLLTLTHRDRYGYDACADGCLRCGLVFLNPVMNAEAYTAFYVDVYRPLVSAYHGRQIDAETIQDEQREYAAALGDLLEPALAERKPRSLLDVGGSTGVVAHALGQRFGLDATVIDPAPLEVDVARALGLRTVTGFVEDYEPSASRGPERFDLIVLCQTVDHLLDVSHSLEKIRALLSDEGLFFVDIVDFRAAYRRVGSVEGAVKVDHPYYITDDTMRALLRRAGFDVRSMNYAADHLHVGYVCAPGSADPDALPSASAVDSQWREIRAVQNPLPGAAR